MVQLSDWAAARGVTRQWACHLCASCRLRGAEQSASGRWLVPANAEPLTPSEGRRRKARLDKENDDS